MPLFSALGRQKQATLYEFEASLNYKDSSRTARATQRNLLSRKKKVIEVAKSNGQSCRTIVE